jgi:hypothetical protein
MAKYDDPQYNVDKEMCLGNEVDSNAAADTAQAYFSPYVKAKVKEVYGVVGAAGTAATMGYTIYKNTTSIGALVLGTEDAGTKVSADLTDTDFEATDVMKLTNIGSDTQMKASLFVVYQDMFES